MLLVIIVIISQLSAANGEIVSCKTNIDRDNQAAEGESVIYSCQTTYRGTHKASLVWHDKQGRQLAPPKVPAKGPLNNTYKGKASVPKTSILTCVLFEEIHPKGVCIPTKNTCQTKEYAVLYSVRSISTRPVLSASPGEELTCSAKGNPAPAYSWMRKEDGEQWQAAGENAKITAELSANSTSAIYKCFATNTVRGQPHTINSAEIKVTAGGDKKRWMIIVGVVIGVIAVIAIIGGIVYYVKK